MKTPRVVVGVGELVLDHIFATRGQSLVYHGTRGGGSVWNVLANVAQLGGLTRAVGVGGSDRAGQAALDELHALGVDTASVSLEPRRRTRIIFERVLAGGRTPRGEAHSFGTQCLVCGSVPNDKRLARLNGHAHRPVLDTGTPAIACFDRVSPSRVEVASELARRRSCSVLDVGRVDYLRFFPIEQIIASLRAFRVVFAPERVCRSLLQRTGLTQLEELVSTSGNGLWFVTRGPDGVKVVDGRHGTATCSDFPAVAVAQFRDDAGAGDALVGHVLQLALEAGVDLGRSRLASVADVLEDALAAIPKKVRRLGARGHIPSHTDGSRRAWLADLRKMTVDEIKSRLSPSDECPFCLLRPGHRQRPVARVHAGARMMLNLSHLGRRVLFAAEHRDAVRECKRVLEDAGPTYCIGTGGSYPVAEFIAMLLGSHSGVLAEATRPLDYLRLGVRSSTLIVVSYSGGTRDCAVAIRHARALGVSRVVLVTNAVSPRLASELRSSSDVIVSYGRRASERKGLGRERGFVSMAATVAPCAVWVAACLGREAVTTLAEMVLHNWSKLPMAPLRLLAQATERGRPVSVLGSGFARPAMRDIESKFVEGNLGWVQLHEAKDFSHGRFMSVLTSPNVGNPAILLSVGRPTPYEKSLCRTLKRNRPFIKVQSEAEGVLGALELLLRVQAVSARCAALRGLNISSPDTIPSAGRRLYRWDEKLE